MNIQKRSDVSRGKGAPFRPPNTPPTSRIVPRGNSLSDSRRKISSMGGFDFQLNWKKYINAHASRHNGDTVGRPPLNSSSHHSSVMFAGFQCAPWCRDTPVPRELYERHVHVELLQRGENIPIRKDKRKYKIIHIREFFWWILTRSFRCNHQNLQNHCLTGFF